MIIEVESTNFTSFYQVGEEVEPLPGNAVYEDYQMDNFWLAPLERRPRSLYEDIILCGGVNRTYWAYVVGTPERLRGQMEDGSLELTEDEHLSLTQALELAETDDEACFVLYLWRTAPRKPESWLTNHVLSELVRQEFHIPADMPMYIHRTKQEEDWLMCISQIGARLVA